jgi:hypothetical protein
MAIPVNKQQLKQAIQDQYSKLMLNLNTIPDHLILAKELEGHSKNTLMSIHDLVAYLIGWGQLVLKWNDRQEQGEHVDFPETGYQWNELGKLAQKFYADYESDDYQKLLDKLDNTINRILALIESKTEDELYQTAWYRGYTLGRMIQLNTSSPYTNATNRIRKWKKQQKLKAFHD